jgi:hypothetical protein
MQGYMGLDQKNKTSTIFGRNQALVLENQEKYKQILASFIIALTQKHACSEEMR